jgi:hypothetical protein
MQRPLTIVAALTLLPGLAWAQRTGTFIEPQTTDATTRVAQRGANFLEIGVGARARALGDAFTGLASGITATYWNPAGLGSTERFSIGYTYSPLYGDLDINHQFAAVALPLFGGALGASYIRLDSGDIPRTDEVNPGGGNATTGDTFNFIAQAMGVHYGRRLTDRLQVGASARYVTEGISQASIGWWSLDFGTMFSTGLYGITLGAAIQNIGPSARYEGGQITRRITSDQETPFSLPVRYKTTPYTLPTTFRFSVVSSLVGGPDGLFSQGGKSDFKLALDLNDAVDTDIQLSVGGEYSFNRIIFLRVGKKFVNEAYDNDFRSFSHALSFGGGFRLPVFGSWMAFDYAYSNMGELQNVHAFSFELGGQ